MESYVATSTCTAFNASSTVCTQFVITQSSSTPLQVSTGVSYQDWLFFSQINVFLSSFIVLGLLFSAFRKRK